MSQPIDNILNHAPCGFLSVDDNGVIVMVNATLSKILAYEDSALLGKSIDMILPMASRIFYQTHFFPVLKLQSQIEEVYFSLRTRKGQDIPMLINAVRHQRQDTYQDIWINDCIFIPIHQRIQYEDEILSAKKIAEAATLAQKEAEDALRQQYDRAMLLGEITHQIRQSLDLSQIFAIAAQEIRQSIHADRVGIFKFHPDSDFTNGIFVSESVINGFNSLLLTEVGDYCFGKEYADLYAQGRIQVVHNIQTAPLANCHKSLLESLQVQANLVVPLLDGQHLWGLLCIHQCDAPRVWQDSEIEFMRLIADQLAIAIQQADLFAQAHQQLQERQQVEAQLLESNQKLAISNQELVQVTKLKDQFLANISHELRTPLNAILGMAEALQDQVFGTTNPSQQKALKTIEQSGTHLLKLINDILDVAKIESGQVTLELTAVSIKDICKSSLSLVRQEARQKKVKLIEQIPDHLPHVMLDERRICQVLINLLSNAVKFTLEGGSVTINVSMTAPSDRNCRLTIAVIDTGIGIAEEHIPRLFQSFIQIDSALNRQYVGTGLGLVLVKSIVELHGGAIALTSQVGVGSTFTIDLPCTNFCPVDLSHVLSASPATSPEQEQDLEPLLAPLILIADDNEANISTISSYLEARGYRLRLAANGEEAIACCRSQSPDLVVMDIQMPIMDGLEATRQIRQDPQLKHIPIIALTALVTNEDRDRSFAAGVSEYLPKPVKLKKLTTTIRQLLAN